MVSDTASVSIVPNVVTHHPVVEVVFLLCATINAHAMQVVVMMENTNVHINIVLVEEEEMIQDLIIVDDVNATRQVGHVTRMIVFPTDATILRQDKSATQLL